LKIFQIHTRKMNLDGEIDFKVLADRTPESTGADIKAICMEAGMFAIRDERKSVKLEDFEKAIQKILVEDHSSLDATGAMFA